MSEVAELLTTGSLVPGNVSVELLSAIVDSVAQPVFVKDRDSRFVLLNRAFGEFVGHSREAMLGKTDADFFPAEEAEFFRRIDVRVFDAGVPQIIEEESLTDARGARRYVRTTKSPLCDAQGHVTHLVGVIVDMSQVKAAEAMLRSANEELERAVEERTRALRDVQQALLRKERLTVLGQLAGGLAHQIRNPLAAMQTAAAVLRRRLGEHSDEDVHQALTVIREEVWEANRIITDLLDYARVKPPSRGDVSVERLLAAALEATTQPPRVILQWDVTPGLIVRVDERQTRDALGNVVRNAFEAMPQGGTLTITAHTEQDSALIALEDTGPGLTRDSMQHLFEPLVTSKPLGLGLGLSTARALVENQGGTIRCATMRGAGRASRFDFRSRPATAEDRDVAPIFVTTWYLEMRERPSLRFPETPPGIVLERMVEPTVREYRFLYDTVGEAWQWVDRRRLDDATLLSQIRDSYVEIFVGRTASTGELVGYFELDRAVIGECKIVYFGLAPAWIGKGLGRWFLERTVECAWAGKGTQSLTVHTCSLDHPRALETYRRAGFVQIDEAYADFDPTPPDLAAGT